MTTILHGIYQVQIRLRPHGQEIHAWEWPQGCKAAAYLWDIRASRADQTQGETYQGQPGFLGIIWIGPTDEWNVIHANASLPVNETVQLLRDALQHPEAYQKYKIWPCQAVGKPGHYSVAEAGGQPIFQAGTYHWPQAEAQAIADRLNKA